MDLLNRLRFSVSADAHGLIDALEDRNLLLKQHLRDAERALDQKRAEHARLEAEASRLGDELAHVVAEAARHDADAELAIREGRDELARKALARALPLGQLARRLHARSAQNARERSELAARLESQTSAFMAMRSRVETALASAPGSSTLCEQPVTDDQVELELLRRKRAAENKEAP